MKKHLPNLLLLAVLSTGSFAVWAYIRAYGIGRFLGATGIVFLLLGIVIFIFFLSIDPAYRWAKSIDLTRNYIIIFISMAVSMTGIVLLVTGQHIDALHNEAQYIENRCSGILSGKAPEIVGRDWYVLQDRKRSELVNVYLFRKKSDRNKFTIIATRSVDDPEVEIRKLTISSSAISSRVSAYPEDSVCPGVFEENISVDYDMHQQLNGHVVFDLSLAIWQAGSGPQTARESVVTYTLESREDDN